MACARAGRRPKVSILCGFIHHCNVVTPFLSLLLLLLLLRDNQRFQVNRNRIHLNIKLYELVLIQMLTKSVSKALEASWLRTTWS